MRRYLIECINDHKTEYAVACADCLNNPDMEDAANNYALDIAVSYSTDLFLITTEGYDYYAMTDEAIQKVINNIDWEDYYNYVITPFEGTDEEFNKLPLIYGEK